MWKNEKKKQAGTFAVLLFLIFLKKFEKSGQNMQQIVVFIRSILRKEKT